MLAFIVAKHGSEIELPAMQRYAPGRLVAIDVVQQFPLTGVPAGIFGTYTWTAVALSFKAEAGGGLTANVNVQRPTSAVASVTKRIVMKSGSTR